jgi:hypothetical protein
MLDRNIDPPALVREMKVIVIADSGVEIGLGAVHADQPPACDLATSPSGGSAVQ